MEPKRWMKATAPRRAAGPEPGLLMSKRQRRAGFIQVQLFHPKSRNLQWQDLPVEIQQKTVRMLAQLLRQHFEKVPASNDRKEADGE